jgi:rhomboid family GlyGly-CTERM serine protease
MRPLAAVIGCIAAVFALSAAFTFVPALHAFGLYQRDAVLQGEWWRVATAMWVHLNTRHWLADALSASGIVMLVAREVRVAQIGLALLACGVLVALGLLRSPEIAWYAGLSGAIHGLIVWGGIRLFEAREAPLLSRLIGVAMCVVVLVKLWLEQSWLSPVVWNAEWGFGVVRQAHALGGFAGVLWWLLEGWRRRRFGRRPLPT